MVEVVAGGDISKEAYTDIENGTIINSPLIDGLSVAEAKERIVEILEKRGIAKKKVNFKLRDWVFSRQRYWGEPIPMIYCEHCEMCIRDRSMASGLPPACRRICGRTARNCRISTARSRTSAPVSTVTARRSVC